MSKLFLTIYHFFQKRRTFFYIILISFTLICIFLASKIKLEEDITNFMPSTPETERTNFVLKNISTNDKIIVTLSVNDSSINDVQDYLSSWADTLAESLKSNPGEAYIKDIFYKVDDSKITQVSDFVLNNLPIFLKESDYERLDSILNKESIRLILLQNKKDLVSPIGIVYKKFLIADPFHVSNNIFETIRKSSVDSLYSVYNGYIFSKNNKNLLLFITSTHSIGETGKNEVLAKALEHNIKNITERSNGNVKITSFGAAVVGVSNANQIKKDSYLATGIAIGLIILLLMVFFRSKRSLLFILIPVLFGVVFSLALLYLIHGTISAIAIGAGSVILGIAINYTLHFLVHYKHCNSVELTIKDLASPMIVGNITTVGAFLSLLFVSAAALRDFGLFASFALIGTIIFVLIVMPHFVKISSVSSSHYPKFFDLISEVRLDKSKWVLLGVIVLTVVFLFFSRQLTFESDLNKISYMTPDQKKAFSELASFTNLGQKSIIHVSEGTDLNGALTKYEIARSKIDSLLQNHLINSVSGVGDLLISDTLQIKKIKQWNTFWNARKESVHKTFIEESVRLGFKTGSFDPFFNSLNKSFTIVNADKLLDGAAFAAPYIINRSGRTIVLTLLYVNPQNEKVVKKCLEGQSGTFVFDRASATKTTLAILSNDFNFVLWISALIVVVFLAFSFGRFELSLLTFIPMIIGWIWILGLMAIFNIKFNIVNIILATFIFGLCDDYSIFIMEGSMKEYGYNRKILNSYKLAVILSALTMFIGIGSLIISKHPAMKSLAQVTIIGMVTVVVISYTIIPFLYRWLTYKKGVKRVMPITARNIINSVWSFFAFLVGSLSHSLIGFFLFKLTKPTDSKKLFFHKCLAFAAGFVVKRLPNVKTRVLNRNGENFLKPSVIICNHQSHIDLVLIMMLSPRIIILTNEWVWNSPFYGSIVKNADFYPVVYGLEGSIEHLSKLIEKGYSIMIFPEGTRSEDCNINRFHRGAFFLAEQLKLDILPIVIHGIGHVLPKTDFLLRRGEVTVEIMDRISPENLIYGDSYQARAKNIRSMYRSHYQKLVSEIETPGYYADKLMHNYIYKGSGVSWQVNGDMKRHNNYSGVISLLPDIGRVLILGSCNGSFPLLLSMVKSSMYIDAVESDEDMVDLARNCASYADKINYILDDPLKYKILNKYDAIIFVDYFSLLSKEEQQLLLSNCSLHTGLIIVSDIKYSWTNRIGHKIAGVELINIGNPYSGTLEKMSEELYFEVSQKENIFAISKKG